MRGSATVKRERTDNLSPADRSKAMRAVRSRNTLPESKLASALQAAGVRYRAHPELPGKPDFLLSELQTVVFVHGCFWHGHGCRRVYPQTNRRYWRAKITRNRRRHLLVSRTLRARGWSVHTVWECQLTLSGWASRFVKRVSRGRDRRRRIAVQPRSRRAARSGA